LTTQASAGSLCTHMLHLVLSGLLSVGTMPPLRRNAWSWPDWQETRQQLLRKLNELPQVREASSSAGPAVGAHSAEKRVREATRTDAAWQLKTSRDGVDVHVRQVPGSKFKMVRGQAVLDVRPDAIAQLFESSDEELIRRFNPLYDSGWDVQRLDRNSKIAYARVRSAFPGVKPRDTVTHVSRHNLREGGTVFLLSAVEHPDVPPSNDVVRAKIISGMHLIEPVPSRRRAAKFTFTQQVNLGGIVPAWMVNILVTREAVQFVRRIEAVAKSVDR